ncbi:MAG: protein-tyrosine phosphatase [Solirubrobacteraceae bacterium]|nr:protein-tyrosine phosphatase [Solirubrobacteraceae bacterium]
MSYVDLHCHLLPGVDDGAPTLDHSAAYARRLRAEGTRDVLVTPHVNDIWSLDILSIPERVAQLSDDLRRRGLALRLHAGAEVAHTRAAGLSQEELETVAVGPAPARWLLLEAPFTGIDDEFLEVARELRARGVGAVIAHPERAPGVAEDGFRHLLALVAEGAVLQVNVCSLLGNNGLTAQEVAVRLLRNGLAYVIASDAHPGSRDHSLQLGFHLALRAGASSEQAWRLTQANPRFLLRHGIPADRPELVPADASQPAASQRS